MGVRPVGINPDIYEYDGVVSVPLSITNLRFVYELYDSCFNIKADTFYYSITDNVLPELLDLSMRKYEILTSILSSTLWGC